MTGNTKRVVLTDEDLTAPLCCALAAGKCMFCASLDPVDYAVVFFPEASGLKSGLVWHCTCCRRRGLVQVTPGQEEILLPKLDQSALRAAHARGPLGIYVCDPARRNEISRIFAEACRLIQEGDE